MIIVKLPSVLLFLLCLAGTLNAQDDLPDRLLVGYWHNWMYTPNHFILTEISPAYDVINISFAVSTVPGEAIMQFVPEPGIYPDPQDFINDVASLQAQGKKVLISIGGANGSIHVDDAADVQDFVSSMVQIIDNYGFDGIDIDLEGGSLLLQGGDTDYQNPTTPLIVYFIEAVSQLLDLYSDDFILTMAPETAYVQGAYSAYAGIWGAYLPVIHALREQLTYIHVQHYNTGALFGLDGVVYSPATADFHVAMADMLLAGFPVAGGYFFAPLAAEQLLIGLPASPQAAGSGYTIPALVQDAVTYLILGEPFEGAQYQLSDPAGYSAFRGLMTWSVNWDMYNELEFSGSYRPFLDSFDSVPDLIELTIDITGNNVHLNWSDPTHSLWYVYRLADPHEAPSVESRIAVTTDAFYIDENALNHTSAFYLVTADEE